MAGHQDAHPLNKRTKEWCLDNNWKLDYSKDVHDTDIRKMLFRYHSDIESLTKRAQKESGREDIVTINGCVNPRELRWHIDYVRPEGVKFIILLRDPADLLWSAFNFWHNNDLDRSQLLPGAWTDGASDYRSPELFHELVLAEKKLLGSNIIYTSTDMYTYIDFATKGVVEMVGRSNVLFLKSEDMKPALFRKTKILEKIANFTGLDRQRFGDHLDELTNCGDSAVNRGPAAPCHDETDAHKEGVYEVSGSKPMLTQSRALIYRKMKKVCEHWSKEYGVEYERCLNVGDEEAN